MIYRRGRTRTKEDTRNNGVTKRACAPTHNTHVEPPQFDLVAGDGAVDFNSFKETPPVTSARVLERLRATCITWERYVRALT